MTDRNVRRSAACSHSSRGSRAEGRVRADCGRVHPGAARRNTAQRTRQNQLAEAKLKDWGRKEDEQLAHVLVGMRALGSSGADGVTLCGTLGVDRALKLMTKIGAGVAEDLRAGGGRGTFEVSAAEAKTQLDAMKSDPEVARKVATKGMPERARWERLNRAWAEGQRQL